MGVTVGIGEPPGGEVAEAIEGGIGGDSSRERGVEGNKRWR